jgi:hypothetical protein
MGRRRKPDHNDEWFSELQPVTAPSVVRRQKSVVPPARENLPERLVEVVSDLRSAILELDRRLRVLEQAEGVASSGQNSASARLRTRRLTDED